MANILNTVHAATAAKKSSQLAQETARESVRALHGCEGLLSGRLHTRSGKSLVSEGSSALVDKLPIRIVNTYLQDESDRDYQLYVVGFTLTEPPQMISAFLSDTQARLELSSIPTLEQTV